MTPFSLTRDINGFNGFGLSFSDTKYSATIAQSTDTTLTIGAASVDGMVSSFATNRYLVIFNFEPGSQVWVANGATAAVPAGATFASTTSELNPAARVVQAGDVLHFITPDSGGAAVSVVIYALL
jgi:uncharacterized protein YqjF (DUF2071 family)